MKNRCLTLLTFVALVLNLTSAHAQPSAFTYHGRLNEGANPASGIYDLGFALYDAAGGGAQQGETLTNAATAVDNGLFTVTLDFGANFPGADRWLEIGVRTNGGGAFTTLNPRQQLTSTPYAITAAEVTSENLARLNVPNTAVQAIGHPNVTSGFITSATVDNPGSGYVTPPTVTVNANGPGSGAVITATISGGSVTALNVSNAGSGYSGSPTLTMNAPAANNFQVFVTSNYFPNVNIFSNAANVFVGDGAGLSNIWRVGGNTGANPANGKFIGTTDDQPLEFKVNGQRALRIEPATNVFGYIPNIVGGFPDNIVSNGFAGGFIGGGGRAGLPNRVGADHATVVGGINNIASGFTSTAMGNSTIASGSGSTAMGVQTIASGFTSTAIGQSTTASGMFSTAMGNRAKANHTGSFVWADSQSSDSASTGNNQFLVRAAGGVGINTTAPGAALEVRTTNSTGNAIRFGFASGGEGNLIAGPSRVAIATGDVVERISILQGTGNVGIGTATPGQKLSVVGNILASGTITPNSDVNAKTNFAPVDVAEILERVAVLPIQEWRFKAEPEGVKHVGPMAQNFRAAFGLGEIPTAIATVDADGVALAAIQGLNQKLEKKEKELLDLKKRLEKLEQRIESFNQ